MTQLNTLPSHVAFIVDGNRRWSVMHKMKMIAGHRKVAFEIFDTIIFHMLLRKIPYITFWVFSTENWSRGKTFVSPIINLFREVAQKDFTPYMKAGVRLKIIGDIDKFPKDLTSVVLKNVEMSEKNNNVTVTIALNYGGRDEILRAIKKLVIEGKYNKNTIHELTEQHFESYLDTNGLPDPDLIIRTSGEHRLSGFLPWQSQYAELAFTPTLFPDFSTTELDSILDHYAHRNRRFGGNS